MHAVLLGTGFPVGFRRCPGRPFHPFKGLIARMVIFKVFFHKWSTWHFSNIRNSSGLLNLAEIPDVALSLSSQRGLLQFSVCGIKSEGNKRGHSQRKSTYIPAKGDKKLKDPISSANESSKSSSQEEILALFRRIQSSISKGKTVVKKRRSTTKVSQLPRPRTDAPRQHPHKKQARVKISSKASDLEPPQQRAILSNDEKVVDASSSESFRLSRPPSNFVKPSPIPLATLPKENTRLVIGQGLPATAAEDMPGMQRIDALKLSELKELAKSIGIKGYSKLKKGELLELLKSLQNSA